MIQKSGNRKANTRRISGSSSKRSGRRKPPISPERKCGTTKTRESRKRQEYPDRNPNKTPDIRLILRHTTNFNSLKSYKKDCLGLST
jgi:hypothetical protein